MRIDDLDTSGLTRPAHRGERALGPAGDLQRGVRLRGPAPVRRCVRYRGTGPRCRVRRGRRGPADGIRRLAQAAGARPALGRGTGLASYRHWLEHQVSLTSARLDPEAEKAFATRAPSASSAWGRLSQEILTAASVPFDGGTGRAAARRRRAAAPPLHEDRDVRRRADEALLGIYEANIQVAAACLDAVVADRLGEDRLRGRNDPMAATLAVDEVDAATVELLLSAVERNTGILERWYDRKRDALGLDEIERYDRLAPGRGSAAHPLAGRGGRHVRGVPRVVAAPWRARAPDLRRAQGRCRAAPRQGRLGLLCGLSR